MLAIEWLAERQEADVPEGPERVCCVTGRPTTRYVPRREVFSKTFGNQDILAAPHSDVVDARLASLLQDGNLRWKSWIVDPGGLRFVKRRAIRELIMAGVRHPVPWGAYAAQDVRRHGGLLTPLNAEWRTAVVQIGPSRARAVQTAAWYPYVEGMYRRGVSRRELQGLEAHPKTIERVGIAEWRAFRAWVRRVRGSAEYDLCVWLLPTKEESDAAE